MYAVLQHAARPFLLGMLALGLALFLTWRKSAAPWRHWCLVWCLYAAVYLWCTPAVAWWLSWQLERDYPPVIKRPAEVEAIVVLGGGVIPAQPPAHPADLHTDSLRRCIKAAELYHQGPPVYVLITGGKASIHEHAPSCASVMADQLAALGIPREQLILEEESSNTEENARYSVAILRERKLSKVVLVTTATHLWRGQHLFRKQGLETIPVGCDYLTQQSESGFFDYLPANGAAIRNQAVLHEWLGAGLLWLRGRW